MSGPDDGAGGPTGTEAACLHQVRTLFAWLRGQDLTSEEGLRLAQAIELDLNRWRQDLLRDRAGREFNDEIARWRETGGP